MEKIVFPAEDLGKILGKHKKNLRKLRKELDATIEISSKEDIIEIAIKSNKRRSGFERYMVANIFEALAFGFKIHKVLLLRNSDYIFRKIDIKSMIKSSRVSVVSGRIIGRQGRVKHLLEKISHCDIVVSDHVVGVIGKTEDVDMANQAINSLIRGSPQPKVLGHLERDIVRSKMFGKPVEDMIEE